MAEENATVYTFKSSGKWYATGRGYVPREVYIETHDCDPRREKILQNNGGHCPGLSSSGSEFWWVVVPDESADGFPLLLRASGAPL